MHCASYWGRFSGVAEDDLKNMKTSVRDVQAILLNLFSADTILIGHSFEHSLYALKVRSSYKTRVSLVVIIGVSSLMLDFPFFDKEDKNHCLC